MRLIQLHCPKRPYRNWFPILGKLLNCGGTKLVWYFCIYSQITKIVSHFILHTILLYKKISKGRYSTEGHGERAECLLAEGRCSILNRKQRRVLEIKNWWSSSREGNNIKISKPAHRVMQKPRGRNKRPYVKRYKQTRNSFSIILWRTKNYVIILKSSLERKMSATQNRNRELQLTYFVRAK